MNRLFTLRSTLRRGPASRRDSLILFVRALANAAQQQAVVNTPVKTYGFPCSPRPCRRRSRADKCRINRISSTRASKGEYPRLLCASMCFTEAAKSHPEVLRRILPAHFRA